MGEKIKMLTELLKDYRLDEMINIANKLYLTEDEVDSFLKGLIKNAKLTNNNPLNYWTNVSLLNIQQNGQSQSEMVTKFQKIIFDELGIIVAINDNTKTNFIYIDDFLFTGNRLYQDINSCFKNAKGQYKVDIDVATLIHTQNI